MSEPGRGTPERAATLLREAGFVQFLVSPDADSVSSAALLGLGLHAQGIPFQARFVTEGLEGLPTLAEDAAAQPVLVGLGGRSGAELEALPGEPLVLDPRQPQVTTRRGEVRTGAPCCTALALPLARSLRPQVPARLALAGLEAAWPGDRGEAIRTGWEEGLALGGVPGLPEAPLVEGIAGSVAPFFPGLGGRARAAKKFLDELRIPAAARPSELAEAEAAALTSALTLQLLSRGASPGAARPLLLPDLGGSRRLAEQLVACCAAGKPALALGLALGDPRGQSQAEELADGRRARLLHALVKLEAGVPAAPLVAEVDLAAELAWTASLTFLAGAPVATLADHGAWCVAHVAAPSAAWSPLAQRAADAAQAAGGVGWGVGPRATLVLPAASAPKVVEALLAGGLL